MRLTEHGAIWGAEESEIGERELASADERYYEVWISRQQRGKSTALRARARALSRDPAVSSVWIIDRSNEWPGRFEIEFTRYGDVADYIRDSSEEIPRVIVWQLGKDVEKYEDVFKEAIYLGGVALIIDECYKFAESGQKWQSDALEDICLAGRHLENSDGELDRVHLILAVQYPKTMRHLLWSQSNEVYCGQIVGELSRKWVHGNFNREGFDALYFVDNVPRFDFVPLLEPERGLPPLPGYGPKG